MIEVIITKEVLYDKCENVEQLYDGFYYPLLVEYKELKKQLEVLKQENQKQKEVIDRAIEYLETATIDPQSMLHYRNCLLEILKEVK